LAFLVYDLIHDRSAIRFTVRDLDRIDEAMTEIDVERTLGIEPGDYCTDEDISNTFRSYYVERPFGQGLLHKEWMSDEGMIQVMFKDDEVVLKRFYPPGVANRTFYERMRSRLGL
jgi:hypothetical protein